MSAAGPRDTVAPSSASSVDELADGGETAGRDGSTPVAATGGEAATGSEAVADDAASAVVVDDDSYANKLLWTVLLAVVAFSASMTIVSASLTVIADDLDATAGTLSWSVTGLFLAMAVATPIMGKLGDTFGHRRIFLIGAAILTIGTALCGLAWSAGAFIAFRIMVGFGISFTMPNGMAMIMAAFSTERRPVAMGWFQMAMTGAPVIGLIAGGPMIEAWGWRTVFAILAPLAAAGWIVAWRVIRPTPRGEPVPIDWLGAGLLGTTVLAFLLALEAFKVDNTTLVAVLATVAAVSLVLFVLVERRVARPLLELRYFGRRNFTGPLIAQPLSQFAYMGGFLIIPLLLGEVYGLGVREIALVLVARPGVFSLASPIGGRLSLRFGQRAMIVGGSIVMVAAMGTFAASAMVSSVALVVAGNALSGLGMGISSPSFSTTIAGAVDPADLGVANGMGTTVMNIGMLTGIQAMFVMLGDGRAPEDFRAVFLFGGIVAAVGIIGGLMVHPKPRRHQVVTAG